MKPGRYDLPVIWRGSNYDAPTFTWLDGAGRPINLTAWTPRARSLNIDFHPIILDAANGVTAIRLTKEETAVLQLGVEEWDWLFEIAGGRRSGPLLAGTVEIKDPVTTTAAEQPFT